MKISKKALLDAIDTALTSHVTAQEEYDRASEIWQTQRRKRWIEQKEPQWRALRDILTRKLNLHQPITSQDITSCLQRSDGYRTSSIGDHAFTENAEPPNPIILTGDRIYKPTAPVKDLMALRNFLAAAEDESFSLESLSRLGFKAPAWVFRAAVSK